MSSTTNSSYTPPRKYILSKEQLEAFQASKTYQDIISYIETLNEAVIGVKLTDACEESQVCADALVAGLLDRLCAEVLIPIVRE